MSVNKCIFIGHLGKDPEIKVTENGVKVAMFSIACSERGYTSANGTQVPERTEWVSMVAWRGLAEVIEKYTHKGSKVYVEGKWRTRSYDAQDGTKRYVTEIVIDSLELLDNKREVVPPPADPYTAPTNGAPIASTQSSQPTANHADANAAQVNNNVTPASSPTGAAPEQQNFLSGIPGGASGSGLPGDDLPF